MSNRQELKKYRRAAAAAATTLAEVEALPRRIGALVRWGENGVIWQRVGDDQWMPLHKSHRYVAQATYGVFPSSHVATSWQGWTRLKGLPVIEPDR